jgi:hypothetical protein
MLPSTTSNFKFLPDKTLDDDSSPAVAVPNKVESLTQCLADCNADSRCKGFLIQKGSLQPNGTVSCWFKNSNAPAQQGDDIGAISFVKTTPVLT